MDKDKYTSETWLKVYHNDLIFIKILEMFDLEEQIALMSVCQRFQYIINDVIWRKKLCHFLIQKRDTVYDIGWRQTAMITEAPTVYEKEGFEEDELFQLLECLLPHLKSLKIHCNMYDTRKTSWKGLAFNFSGSCENMQVLEYVGVILKDDNIKSISENCKQLKELHLTNIGDKLTGKYLDELSNLEILCLKSKPMTWSHEQLLNICKLPLKNLQLFDVSFGKKDTNVICDTMNLSENLKKLVLLCHEIHQDNAFDILRCSSKPFAQLQILHISEHSFVQSHHFDLISEKCLNLQKLHITNCTFKVDNLKCPSSLKELYIERCSTVSPEIAWYILTELNLTELQISFIESREIYNFDYSLALGCSLKSLEIIGNDQTGSGKEFWMEILENSSSDSFRQLERLSCKFVKDSHMKCISQKCPNLQHLYVEAYIVTGKYIDRMKNLKSLTIYDGFNLMELIQILQSVRDLESLSFITFDSQKIHSVDCARVPSIGSCSFRKLEICYDFFLICKMFWLNLLRSNLFKMELRSECGWFNSEFDYEFLLAILEDADILKNLTRFYIYGYVPGKRTGGCEHFIEFLYHPSLINRLGTVHVDDCRIDTSLGKPEFRKHIKPASMQVNVEFKLV